MSRFFILTVVCLCIISSIQAQKSRKNTSEKISKNDLYDGIEWRSIGPFRGGRSVASCGVVNQPLTYYMGSTGGGVWKSENAGSSWKNISDGQFQTGTVGAISVSESDPNVVYAGMGEHAIRGVMTSSGDGVYRSLDAGKTWKHVGLASSYHISDIIIHPTDPDIVFVAVQGPQYGPGIERGVYKSTDGGESWQRVLYVNQFTGASSLSMDMNNPRILYASMWQHQRFPWTIESGGEGSGLYKSVDMGNSWEKMEEGLPETFGKSGISVSRANSELVFAVIEAKGEKSGVYRSVDAGKKWSQINKDRVNVARSWYYMEIFADPVDENVVFVLNAPVMKSIDGGKTFQPVPTPHGDNHHLWINPQNNQLMINSNDGGANVSLDGGQSWSSQRNQPTAQFYRVSTDNLTPYNVYGGQQDNSAISIASRTNSNGIGWKDWYSVAGCESAYLAFDPNDPKEIYGGCYQGIIERWSKITGMGKPIKEYPELALGSTPQDQKYRFNWNAPIISSPQNPQIIYHAGNVIFKTEDKGISWQQISPDLTRDEKEKQQAGGGPFTNEAAGGENYNTIMYLSASIHEKGVLWAGTDDGLIHITKDEGTTWKNVTPGNMPEGIVNSIEVSPHDPATAYATLMRYKFNDLSPYIFKTNDYGESWTRIDEGIKDAYTFARVVREDPIVPGLLYAGTETGLYISWNSGEVWEQVQLNLPVVPINDLTIRDNDLVAATAGRSFWILDDLSAFQQLDKINNRSIPVIIDPKDQYKLAGASADTPADQGTNAPEGITFDYYLPEIEDSLEVVVKIFTEDGELVRQFSSQEEPEFSTWALGPPKPKTPGRKPGINRFTWDFRRSTLPVVENVAAYGDLRGSTVKPGSYTIRLRVENDSTEVKVNLLPDPRIPATPQQYREQENFLLRIESRVSEIHKSVSVMRSAKNQLANYQKLLKGRERVKVLVDSAASLVEDITAWEEKLIQPRQKTFQDVINFTNKLNSEYLALKSFVDVPYPEVTAGAKERLTDLDSQWKEFADERDRIINTEMKDFNKMYLELDLPAIIME